MPAFAPAVGAFGAGTAGGGLGERPPTPGEEGAGPRMDGGGGALAVTGGGGTDGGSSERIGAGSVEGGAAG